MPDTMSRAAYAPDRHLLLEGERMRLTRGSAGHARDAGDGKSAEVFEAKATAAETRAELVRRAVMAHQKLSGDATNGEPSG